MTAQTLCLRCGGGRLISAQLKEPTDFCVDQAAHHGVLHLGLRAAVCEDCGHVEFRVPDPSRLLGPVEPAGAKVIQEEDF